MRIGKRFRFEAAHVLIHHRGQCANLHGHSYVAELVFEGVAQTPFATYPRSGMLIDFSDISAIWNSRLKPQLDHSEYGTLNVVLRTEMPTAEYIAAWIVANFLRWNMPIESCKLWETDTSWSLCRRDDPMVQLALENLP